MRVEEAEHAFRNVYREAERVEGFRRVEHAVNAFGQALRHDEEAAGAYLVVARAERERAHESLLPAARGRAAQTADVDASPSDLNLDARHGSELLMFLGRSLAAMIRKWLTMPQA